MKAPLESPPSALAAGCCEATQRNGNALHLAVSSGNRDLDLVRVLLPHMKTWALTDSSVYHRTPEDEAIAHGWPEAAAEIRREVRHALSHTPPAHVVPLPPFTLAPAHVIPLPLARSCAPALLPRPAHRPRPRSPSHTRTLTCVLSSPRQPAPLPHRC